MFSINHSYTLPHVPRAIKEFGQLLPTSLVADYSLVLACLTVYHWHPARLTPIQ